MEEQKEYKQCHMCCENIKINASICRHCGMVVNSDTGTGKGEFATIRVKAMDRIYKGDIFITGDNVRISDILNDKRKFISLDNAFEEKKNREIEIGFIAINKTIIEWVREKRKPSDGDETFESQSILD